MRSEITIPTDVLCDIFHLLCHGPIALHDLKNKRHFCEFPWAAGQVCRHWRWAFLSHTRLWSSFALKPGAFSATYIAEMNRRATIYLERSGQRPLTIAVSTLPGQADATFPKTVWEILLSRSKRWKKANLVLEERATLDGLLRCRGPMSTLETLRIVFIPDYTAMEDFNAFEVAPRLTELHVVQHEYVKEIWHFPWAQLTKLKIESSSYYYGNDLWKVLFQLENIEELHIITSIYSSPPSPDPLPIKCLPGLRLLETSFDFTPMFSWITAPLLEHLHLHRSNGHSFPDDSEAYERALASLIQRSSCQIHRLAFEECTAQEIRIVLDVLASIEELSITSHSGHLDIIRDITPGLDGCIYLPKLKVLQVACFTHVERIENDVTVFSRLLEAWGKELSLASWHDVVPLSKFVLRLGLPLGELNPKLDKVLEIVHGWPSFARVYINGSRLTPSLRLPCNPDDGHCENGRCEDSFLCLGHL